MSDPSLAKVAGVVWEAYRVPISTQLFYGTTDSILNYMLKKHMEEAAEDMAREAQLDLRFGPGTRHKPDRSTFLPICRRLHRAERVILPAGRPAGPMVRAR